MRPVEVLEHAPPRQRDGTQESHSTPGGESEGESQDDPNDDHGYDPTVMRPQDVEWAINCRCIGFNPHSNRAEEDPDYPDFEVEPLNCYFELDEEEDSGTLVFPYHWDCATILWRRLVGPKNTSHVNMNLVYESMYASHENYCANLPQEITHQLLSYLDHASLMNLCQASWTIHSNAHENNALWRECARHQLPWFFELHECLESVDSASIDSMKGLYLWARKTTMPRKYLRLPYTVIANRRRIWSVCDQLAERYNAALLQVSEEESK